MKKVMVVACLFSASAYAAENTKDLMLSVGGTLFHIVKDDMYKYDSSVDLMVVGRNQQKKLKEPAFNDSREVGKLYSVENNIVRVLPKESASASDDDTYKPYVTNATKLWKKAEDKTIACNIFAIIEPRIMHGQFEWSEADTYGYFPKRPHPEKKNHFFDCQFFGDEAILEARRDLVRCYLAVLQEGLEVLGDKDNKTIALASLGTAVGVPRKAAAAPAFDAIVNFLKNNPGKYSLVQLFIKKRSEYVLFRELIAQYLEQQH